MDASNYYEDRAKRQFLNKTNENEKTKNEKQPEENKNPETTQEKLKRTTKDVGMDVAIGVLGGGLGAAILGPYSFIGGLGLTFYGHYIENPKIATFGLGMMSSSSKTAAEGVKQDPKAGMLDNMQERVKAYGKELQRKVFLDKLIPNKKPDTGKEESNLKGTVEKEAQTKSTTQLNDSTETKTEEKHQHPDNTNTSNLNGKEDTGQDGKKNKYKNDGTDFNDIADRLY
jgi:hypothetical protein